MRLRMNGLVEGSGTSLTRQLVDGSLLGARQGPGGAESLSATLRIRHHRRHHCARCQPLLHLRSREAVHATNAEEQSSKISTARQSRA